MMKMNRIDIKLGTTMILLLLSILLPLGFVMNQIFYGFYINQSQEETLLLSSQYASLINDHTVENRLEIVEVASRISNQKMIVLSEEGELLAYSNLSLTTEDITTLRQSFDTEDEVTNITNSFIASDGVTYLVTASAITIESIEGHVIVFSSLESILQSIETVQRMLLLSGAGSLLVGFGLTYFMSKRLSQPLVNMEKAARQIAKGKLETKINQRSTDELGSLARAINDLAADLKRLNEQRREFFANISHELRTPLTYLKGYSKVLRSGLWKTEEEKNQYLEIIDAEATRLTYLVNDLFDLAQMDEGRFNLQFEKVRLDEMITLVINKTSYKAMEKNIVLTFHSEATQELEIMGDPLRIEQVLLNIVENAIKYTESGWIKLSVMSDSEEIIIEVEDTGMGIDKEELPYIFERFYRVEKSRSRAYGGSGLGLSIVKQLVELHGGKVAVESTVGKGSIFTITLPKSIDLKGVETK